MLTRRAVVASWIAINEHDELPLHYHAAGYVQLTRPSSERSWLIRLPGASARNISPILEQLHLLLADNPSGVAVKTADASGTTEKKGQKRILEIGSYPYEHIRRFAEEWPGYEWWGSGRTEEEIA